MPVFAVLLRSRPCSATRLRSRAGGHCSARSAWSSGRFRGPAVPRAARSAREKRPHHVSESWPHIRLEECGSCRTYIKGIDLRENGLAVPIADELASVELDLWAAEQGLSKLRTNLLGL